MILDQLTHTDNALLLKYGAVNAREVWEGAARDGGPGNDLVNLIAERQPVVVLWAGKTVRLVGPEYLVKRMQAEGQARAL